MKIRIRDYPYNSIILPALLYEENHIQISSLLDIVVCIYIELSTQKKKKKKKKKKKRWEFWKRKDVNFSTIHLIKLSLKVSFCREVWRNETRCMT